MTFIIMASISPVLIGPTSDSLVENIVVIVNVFTDYWAVAS